nr:hypothetical protein [uncultured Gammaproteobacteria bacterium]
MKECNSCGKCCIKYSNGGLSASDDEIEYWEVFRPDISRYVHHGNIWINPDTGEQIERCPWLRQAPNSKIFTCAIYHDRPDDCRFYPVTIAEMIKDECEMLESHDIENPKEAQKDLNKLMINSRSSY